MTKHRRNRSFILVLCLSLTVAALSFARPGHSAEVRIINSRGRERQQQDRTLGACVLVKAAYHPSDRSARLLNAQGGECNAHYQVPEERNCYSQCGGGTESWTYSDPNLADYCSGYLIDMYGCEDGCSEDVQSDDCCL